MSQTGGEMGEQGWRTRFGLAVKQHRQVLALNQSQLGAMVGLSHGRISHIEHGDPQVPMAHLITLAQRLGIDMNRVLGVPPPPPLPGSEPWYSDMLMLRLPAHVQHLWPQAAQQAIVLETLEALTQAMRRYLPPPPPPEP